MEDCLEKWRQALERREMKRNGSRQKQDRIQEDVCPNGREVEMWGCKEKKQCRWMGLNTREGGVNHPDQWTVHERGEE